MADPALFRQLLKRMNVPQPGRIAISQYGVATLPELVTLTDKDIGKMISESVTQAQSAEQNADDRANIRVPFATRNKLRAAKYWFKLMKRTNQPTGADNLTDIELEKAQDRIVEVTEKKEAIEGVVPTPPPHLKSFATWSTWWELWDTYISQIYGAADIPLTYVYREDEIVTNETRNQTYETQEEMYAATTVLSGNHFVLDNRRIWNELKTLTVDGPGWTFIKVFEDTKNGRAAVLALVKQNEGDNSKMIRKQKAYASLGALAFSGPRKTFSFQHYVTAHMKCHNELAICGEPVSESKKVTDFIAGISDTTLSSGIAHVWGDQNLLTSFKECQLYLSKVAAASKIHKRMQNMQRGVAALGSETKPLVHNGNYTNK